MKDDIFNKISPSEALEILKQIAKTDKKLKKRIIELAEELLEPFLQELYRLFDLKMHQEANFYCMGILKGIYQYEEDSGSEFKDWATDVPGESFGYIIEEWKKDVIITKTKTK